ncbi:MAG: ribosome-associated translation inhibitor RaiA [Bacteroidota bacterium]
MKVEIQSIHFDADKKLLEFITKKVEKVNTFFEGISSIDVYLRLEKDVEKNNKSVEIKLNVPGNQIFVKENASTFETATDFAIDKVKAQVKKHKERIQEKNLKKKSSDS